MTVIVILSASGILTAPCALETPCKKLPANRTVPAVAVAFKNSPLHSFFHKFLLFEMKKLSFEKSSFIFLEKQFKLKRLQGDFDIPLEPSY
jgi:hypothetical protein